MSDPQIRQKLFLYGSFFGFLILIIGLCVFIKSEAPVKEIVRQKHTIQSPREAVDPREVWVNRVEKSSRVTQGKLNEQQAENKLLKERLGLLEDIIHGHFKKNDASSLTTDSIEGRLNQSAPSHGAQPLPSNTGSVFPKQPENMSTSENSFFDKQTNSTKTQTSDTSFQNTTETPQPKWLELSLLDTDIRVSRHVDNYIPKGTYAKAVLLSGSVASTATNAQSNPLPIVLRLVDEGNLPRGWKSTVKDAVLIGSCYGDISSERVLCRLEGMSWVEADGNTVEREVEGWIIGEDGRPGLRGRVVDRSQDIAQQSLVAGILSGMAQLLQQNATRSVFPVTPFGQTNALDTKDILKGSVGAGASSALERLADFAIKRAESMSPVLIVNSGRVIDIVFRKGIHLRGENRDFKMIGHEGTQNPSSFYPPTSTRE